MAGAAAAAPRDLVARVKQTIVEIGAVPTRDEAVDYELGPQVWSINQPAFQERLAALRRRISSKG
jgi:enoyl-CoA hydratase